MATFKRLTENDDSCPKCGLGVVAVIEQAGRGTYVRSDVLDACEDPSSRDGIDRYYLHLNQRL